MEALAEYEHLWIHMSLIPTSFLKQFQLEDIVDKDGYVYTEVHGGMHGFQKVVILAHRD